MMIAALLALAAGAVAGIFLAVRHFRHKRLPVWVAAFHGVGGATGFALVLLTVVYRPDFQPIRNVLYLLIATVALGVVNLLFHIRRVRHRTSLILLHGLTAVCAAGSLVYAIWVHYQPAEASPGPSEAPVQAPETPEPGPVAKGADPDGATVGADAGEAMAEQEAPEDEAGEFVVAEEVSQALDRTIQFGSASTRPASQATIDQIGHILKEHPEIELVEVQGHADERGSDADNVALTRQRAESTVNALVAQGVARERLRVAGYGSRCPADPDCRGSSAPDRCHTPSQWAEDRRVELVVLKAGGVPYDGEIVCPRGADLIPE